MGSPRPAGPSASAYRDVQVGNLGQQSTKLDVQDVVVIFAVVSAVLGALLLISFVCIFYLNKCLKRLRMKHEELVATHNGARQELDNLWMRLKNVEDSGGHKRRCTVTFSSSVPQGEGTNRMSRAASTTSSLVYHDAHDDWMATEAFLNEHQAAFGNGATKTNPYSRFDHLHETGQHHELNQELKELLEDDPNNIELLWRYARSCHALGYKFGKDKRMIQEGYKHAMLAYEMDDGHFDVLQWTAALSGSLTDFLGTKERIQEGFKFREYLNKALAIKHDDWSLLHMRGRLAYNIANLTWVERKAAATFFADPPTATMDEAIEDFLEVDKIRADWAENLYYLAKSYQAKGDKAAAKAIVNRLINVEPIDQSDRNFIDEAKKLSKSL
ncbi:unnamed protein product [Bursaphelenchus xylophilus]|uniref:(pine wood nematode) hypothetical protein n=1 Tax=Bursaphelenchus xylophilus TaxID=6326 RepID=A0A1I7S9X9_BURXY|nr:unnamed protein product [Bursaphelenchus xylophilus]CAG9126194.1 unnamed protein product [Bursaphelenchus xylophilus]